MRTFFLVLLPSLIEGHARYFLENNRCNTHTLEAGKTIMGVRRSFSQGSHVPHSARSA